MSTNANARFYIERAIEWLREDDPMGRRPDTADDIATELEAVLVQGDQCFFKADPNEPIFVLRAQDVLAAESVREWAEALERHCDTDGYSTEQYEPVIRKANEARALADRMEAWPAKKVPD